MSARTPIFALILVLCACISGTPTAKIALLAPFEGRYREVGYEALYAARLALADSGTSFTLLPLDDGGTAPFAASRAAALGYDPQMAAVILIGDSAAAAETQTALGDLPALIIGVWGGGVPDGETVFAFSSREASAAALRAAMPITETAALAEPMSLGDSGALLSFAQLRAAAGLDMENVEIVSSGRLPTPDFAARYRASAPFAPDPRLLAAQTYEAVSLLASILESNDSASTGLRKSGLFVDGWRIDAPLLRYRLDNSGALRLDDAIE